MVPMILRTAALPVFILLAALLLAGCAGQVQPGGGPVDTVPPVVIRTLPDTNAVRVQTSSIELEFSEYVDRRSVEESIFISPYVGTLEYDWGSTDVTIRFADTLRRNTTYVLSVGTDVVDIRARNRMAQAFTLAFSTGDSLDHGSMRGRVFDDRPDGVMVFAYNLGGIDRDTLDPSHVRPDYLMQTGADGRFHFRNIAFGPYRLIAVRDEYKNLVYDREVDAYGVGQGDITLSAETPAVNGLQFRLAKEDTTRPFLTSVTASDQYHLLIRFSEPVDTLTLAHAVFAVFDTVTLVPVRTGALSADMANTALLGIELQDPLDSLKAYRLRAAGVADRSGNVLDTAHATADFAGSGIADTSRPKVTIRTIADSVRGIPVATPFALVFGKPVAPGPAMAAVRLVDSAKAVVPLEVRPRTPSEMLLIPEVPLKPMAWYTFRIVLDSILDSRGNRFRDTTMRVAFQTMDLRNTGTIDGQILDLQPRGAAVVTAHSVDMTPPRSATLVVPKGNVFGFKDLLEGKYRLEGYRDEDGNGMYSPGLPYPYRPAERFGVYPDTVKVRARWGIEGVILKLPE